MHQVEKYMKSYIQTNTDKDNLTDYSSDGKKFSGTLHFTLYEHFGLDKPDVEKIYGDLDRHLIL